MDIRKFAIAAAAALFITASPAHAANSAKANGKVLLLVPLTLTKVDDLHFGTVVESAVAGTVTINAATGARTHSAESPKSPAIPGSGRCSPGPGRPASW